MSSPLQFLTRNIFVSGLVLIAAVGTMTVVAIQLFAPADYKPSSILAANNSSSSVTTSQSFNSLASSQTSSTSVSTTQINIGSQVSSAQNQSQTSSLTKSGESSSAKSIALQTYKNQYFPNFELNYDSDWKVENTTVASAYPGLLIRNINFSKAGKSFNLKLYPLPLSGCGGTEPIISQKKDVGSGIFRVTVEFDNTSSTYYTKAPNSATCPLDNRIVSNISAADIPKYAEFFGKDKFVNYIFDVELISPSESAPVSEYIEIDKIISQSKFQ